MSAVTEGWVLTQRDLLHWVRQPWAPIFGLLFSVMLLLVFGFLFGGAMTVPGGGRYLDFLLPGMLTLTMMFGVEATTTAMATDARRGVTDRFRSMPISSAAVCLGRAGVDMVSSMVELAVLIGCGLLVGWRITGDPASAALAVLLLLALRFAVLWVGIFLGLALPGESTTQAVQVLVWPFGFLSTALVSAETMPGWLGAVSAWNPISATATAVRQLVGSPTGVTGGPLESSAVLLALAWPVLLTAVFLPLSGRAYRRLRH
ncbi:MAG: transporter [Actinotalea sp.]|nr:transporter [Actinotalea sp.]